MGLYRTIRDLTGPLDNGVANFLVTDLLSDLLTCAISRGAFAPEYDHQLVLNLQLGF